MCLLQTASNVEVLANNSIDMHASSQMRLLPLLNKLSLSLEKAAPMLFREELLSMVGTLLRTTLVAQKVNLLGYINQIL